MDVMGSLTSHALLRPACPLQACCFQSAAAPGAGVLCQQLPGGAPIEPLLLLDGTDRQACHVLTARGAVTVTLGEPVAASPLDLAAQAGRPTLLAYRRSDGWYWGRALYHAEASAPSRLCLQLQPLPAAVGLQGLDDYVHSLHLQELALARLRQCLQAQAG